MSYRISQWDYGKEDGSLVFEMVEQPTNKIFYVIKRADGSYRHFNSEMAEITKHNVATSVREMDIKEYMDAYGQYFFTDI